MSAALGWLAGAYLALLLGKALAAGWQIRRRQLPPPVGPGEVTVLQAVLGGDPGLRAVLADDVAALSDADFLWLVDDGDPDGQAVARDLAAGSARVRVLSFPAAPDGQNPKTFKLAGALPHVATPHLLVLDDDARLSGTALAALLAALADADLATALPFYRDGRGLPARLLAQFVDDNAALTYLPLLPLHPPVTVNGMCYAMRTDRLRDLGGFAPIVARLTDDLAIADLVRDRGGRIAQLAVPVEMATHLDGLPAYLRQMHRWFLFATLLLRRQPLAMKLAIVLLHGLHPLLLWALLGATVLWPSTVAVLVLAAVVLLRAGVLVALQRAYAGRAVHRPLLSVASELAQPLHLLHACLRRTITWRTRRYRVFDDVRFESRP